jgi:AraC-like DNA-binding protein
MRTVASAIALRHLLKRKSDLVEGASERPLEVWPTLVREFLAGVRQLNANAIVPVHAILTILDFELSRVASRRWPVEEAIWVEDDEDVNNLDQLCIRFEIRFSRLVSRVCTAEKRLVDRLAVFLTAHLSDHLTSATLSRSLNVRPAELARAVRRSHSCSVHELVKRRRLEIAYSHVMRGDKIEAVICAVGYRNRTSFFTDFRRSFGASPRQLQLRLGNGGGDV